MDSKEIISELVVALIVAMAMSLLLGSIFHGSQEYFPWYTACGVVGYMAKRLSNYGKSTK